MRAKILASIISEYQIITGIVKASSTSGLNSGIRAVIWNAASKGTTISQPSKKLNTSEAYSSLFLSAHQLDKIPHRF